ncbi:MAG: hypothetical protein NT150_12870 [Bacteroidetes bacterium]|nr:hypothetical protein [Bacteroidota bacterium]
MKNTLCFLLLAGIHFVQAQDILHLKFSPEFKNAALNTDSLYLTSKGDSIRISSFRMYISSIEVIYKNGTTFKEKNSYHLLDIDDISSFDLELPASINNVQKIVFSIGVDSLASVSGALGGDLDPGKGMYWAWQSGYVNLKIEGTSPSCKTHKSEFGFHIGGYMHPFYALRTITLPVANTKEIEINIDLARFFENIDLSKSNSIMIPSKEAMKIADSCAKIFSVK